MSLSARRAWIEIAAGPAIQGSGSVALRKESVDRNCSISCAGSFSAVALRKESVDRNLNFLQCLVCRGWSLSARRAWIEMLGSACPGSMQSCRSPQGERG